MGAAIQDHLPTQDYLIRLASFRNISLNFLPEKIYPMSLSMSGFYYPGSGSDVICSACVKKVNLKIFLTEPSDRDYHNSGCPFVKLTSRDSSIDSQNIDTTSNIDINFDDLRVLSVEPGISPEIISAVGNVEAIMHSSLRESDQSHGRNNERSVREVTRSLLDRENQVLKDQMKCKSCKVSPVQDLFLPCGEMYTCKDCSNKFTHCPSCGKRILGTVTVFFS